MFDFQILQRLGLPTQHPKFLPPQLENYRRALAESTDTPDEYAVAYILAAAATAAGANVTAYVQTGWCIRANMYMAVIGYKGSGKSTLADKVLNPLKLHEADLQEQEADLADEAVFGDEDADDEKASRKTPPPPPCVIVNNCTGPSVIGLLERNRRQLLVNPDELSALFIRNTGGTDRQLWCELYDGRRLRRERASSRSKSTTLDAPYVCVLGGVQPEVFECAYSKRGDDGLLDRFLLVGDGTFRNAAWPRDADDAILNGAWHDAVTRLLHVEELAPDVIDGRVEARFTRDARQLCEEFLQRLNHLVAVIGVPESQRGVVKKLTQHALKLALLHRALRWAAGEFGERGPFGDIDADDVTAACEATLFFLGRWLIWRPELLAVEAGGSVASIGLSGEPGDDPALQTLAATAVDTQTSIRAIERFVRYVRYAGIETVYPSRDGDKGMLASFDPAELRGICDWLVLNGHGKWLDEHAGEFRLTRGPSSARRHRRQPRHGVTA